MSPLRAGGGAMTERRLEEEAVQRVRWQFKADLREAQA